MSFIEPLFKSLNDAGVRYVVVDSLAGLLHGYARLTADVDLVVDLDPAQVRSAIDTLTGLGLRPRVPVNPGDFADGSIRETWVRDRGMQVFSLSDPANPMRVVDLFVTQPVPFEQLWSRAEVFDLQSTTVRVASIPDLIHLKRLAGRAQDQTDIEHLEAILEAKRERTDA